MYCPRCSSIQSDDIKFCTSCGANLAAVRQAVDARDDEQKFNWGDTWVADMFLSPQAQAKRKAEIEMRMGITPETKRYNEMKAGVIVSSVGIALMLFLFVFMQGLIESGKIPPDAASILSHLWIAGVIPLFVGLALLFNGLFISKRLVEIANRKPDDRNAMPGKGTPTSLPSADTSEFIPTDFSVTDHTTKHLNVVRDRSSEPQREPSWKRDTD
jgi:hypothetical protein